MLSIEKRSFLNKLSSVLLHPALLAALVTITILLILDPICKYKVEILKSHLADKENALETYYDINNDGRSERIISFENNLGEHAIKIMDQNENIFGQWNIEGKVPIRGDRFSVGDFNNDSLSEIYLFSQSNDSILLYIIEPFINNEPIPIFVDSISRFNNVIDYTIMPGHLIDMNNDGYKDFVFNINAGFSLQPRNIYIYDIKNRKILKSEKNGVNNNELKFLDINDDGFLEIIANTSSTDNIKPPLQFQYHDSSSWLMVYDNTLKYLFPPIEFPGFKSYVETIPVNFNKKKCILLYYRYYGTKRLSDKIELVNNKGEIIKSNIMQGAAIQLKNILSIKDDPFHLSVSDRYGNIVDIDSNLQMTYNSISIGKSQYFLGSFELDGNEGEENLLANENHSLFYIEDAKSNKFVSFDLNIRTLKGPFSVSVINNPDRKPLLFIQKEKSCNIIDYHINPLYKMRWIVYLLIYGGILLFIFLVRQLYKIQLDKRIRLENKISELQLNLESNQLNPHFIFNAINSITSTIYKDKKEEAYQLGVKLTNMMRETVLSSKSISRSLKSEIEFTRNYIELQQQRFIGIFKYSIKIDPETDTSIEVPRMLIHNFAENAIKHGLLPKKENGLLEIKVFNTSQTVNIIIQDNGVGRKSSRSAETKGTGTGIKTMDEILKLLKKINKQNISFSVIDLYDNEDKAVGTKVEISISH